jgi:hypothetical protein
MTANGTVFPVTCRSTWCITGAPGIDSLSRSTLDGLLQDSLGHLCPLSDTIRCQSASLGRNAPRICLNFAVHVCSLRPACEKGEEGRGGAEHVLSSASRSINIQG